MTFNGSKLGGVLYIFIYRKLETSTTPFLLILFDVHAWDYKLIWEVISERPSFSRWDEPSTRKRPTLLNWDAYICLTFLYANNIACMAKSNLKEVKYQIQTRR